GSTVLHGPLRGQRGAGRHPHRGRRHVRGGAAPSAGVRRRGLDSHRSGARRNRSFARPGEQEPADRRACRPGAERFHPAHRGCGEVHHPSERRVDHAARSGSDRGRAQPRLRGPSHRGTSRGCRHRDRAQGAGGSPADHGAVRQAANRQGLSAGGTELLRARPELIGRRAAMAEASLAVVPIPAVPRLWQTPPQSQATRESRMSEASQPSGPDFEAGIPESTLADGGMLVGRVGEHSVLLARRGSEVFAIDASCTHYGGPLGEGLLVGETVRCPWHHACFSLRTGEAIAAPALAPVNCWRVERTNGRLLVREKAGTKARHHTPAAAGEHIVIVGGGAAGFAAAEMLRREEFGGAITLLSADESAPYDRPNLSKDYLAGNAPEEWIPLRPPEFYAQNRIDLRLRTEVTGI